MNKRTYTIGETVEKYCAGCNRELIHTVKTVTKTGLISKVVCSECGAVGSFKPNSNAAKAEALAAKTGEAYDRRRTYKSGQILSHPTFGTGEVMRVFDTDTMDVLFMDRTRRLIHSRM
jgi:hypothetical protein